MIFLIDGYNLVFRSYYGIRELRRSDGFPTNAIHGWMKTLGYLMNRKDCDRMIVFFDRGADEREELMPEYKQNRSETPADLELQVPIIKELTGLMGLQIIEKDGVEADDLIGAYAKQYATAELPIMIVSADKDLAQCLEADVLQLLPPPTANPRIGWRILKKDGVFEKFGVHSEQIAQYLALVGDTSDNIPGIPGVGPKTAAKWLNEYGSLETIIEKANYIQPARFQTPVAQSAELLRRNLKLTTLDLTHEIPQVKCNPVNVVTLEQRLLELEMKQTAEEVKKRFA
jgi:DNA polymerase I